MSCPNDKRATECKILRERRCQGDAVVIDFVELTGLADSVNSS